MKKFKTVEEEIDDFLESEFQELKKRSHYYDDMGNYTVTFCPFCDCQRAVRKISEERFMLYGSDNKVMVATGWYCSVCNCVIYKDISEGVI